MRPHIWPQPIEPSSEERKVMGLLKRAKLSSCSCARGATRSSTNPSRKSFPRSTATAPSGGLRYRPGATGAGDHFAALHRHLRRRGDGGDGDGSPLAVGSRLSGRQRLAFLPFLQMDSAQFPRETHRGRPRPAPDRAHGGGCPKQGRLLGEAAACRSGLLPVVGGGKGGGHLQPPPGTRSEEGAGRDLPPEQGRGL